MNGRPTATGILAGALAIAAVSGLIALLDIWLDADGLISLYLLAIFPVAIFWGFWPAAIVALASFFAFEFFFVPPLHSLEIAHGEDAVAIGVSLLAAFLVGELARRAREGAVEAQVRAREAALRRVATLVAREAPPREVFEAVAEEVARLLAAEGAAVQRFDDDGGAVVVGDWGFMSEVVPVGTRFELARGGVTALVQRTGRPARFDHYEDVSGTLAAGAQRSGMRVAVGCPVIVAGRTWGAIVAATSGDPLPAEAESRMAEFTELVAAAISNVQARSDLTASRARLVAAADEERRRVVRDIHDGAQQRMVQTVLTLKLARQELDRDGAVGPLVSEALEQAELSTKELRDLAHGILPSVLTRGGLRAAVDTFVARIDVPVRLDVTAERFPAEIEASAYFIVAEALTNVVKHAHAREAQVQAVAVDGALRVEVRDDGVGGADAGGHGLTGIGDRVTALGGRLVLDSPAGGGTVVAATFPL